MPSTAVETPEVVLEEVRVRRAERRAERTRIEAQLADAPRVLAEGRGTPGDTARLKAELSDLNDAISYLDGQIASAESEIAAATARRERDSTITRMAEIADRATQLQAELEEARRLTVRTMEQGIRAMQAANRRLVEVQREFDALGDTLVEGFAMPNQHPWERQEQIRATAEEIGTRAGSMEAILTEWRALGGEYSAPTNKTDYRHGSESPKLVDLGETGRMLDTAAGFRLTGFLYAPKG